MLTAMMTRTIRKYNKLPKETPLWNTTPVDARISPFATEAYKKRKFFHNAYSVFPCVVGQDTLMEEIKHCDKKIKEAITSNDNVREMINATTIIDPETLQFVPKGEFPSPHMKAVVNASNTGRVIDNTINYITYNPLFPGTPYNFFYHCYYTSEKFIVMGFMPKNIDIKLVKYIEKEMNKIFNPESLENFMNEKLKI